jgi:2,3-bisphosphoglycerate-independent phosphoglycerate mutase
LDNGHSGEAIVKTVMIIIDGLNDEPISELQGKTPLEAAHIPNIHYIANKGKVGRINTTFTGFPIESMVCIMGLLGYDPKLYYPSGRASFEAMAKGIPLRTNDLVLRCNLITADTENKTIQDFTAGMIEDSHARALITRINLPFSNWELYPGQSYRNTLIIRDTEVSAKDITCFEPHMNIGGNINDILPRGTNDQAQMLASQIGDFLLDTQHQIAQMEISRHCSANMMWVWSPSVKPVWPAFKKMTGLDAAIVGGLDFIHGIAMAAGMHFDVIPGATGYIDTNYQAKADYTIKYLQDFDFVLTHVNAADEEAHQKNHLGKIDAIEKIDRFIVAPVLCELVKNYSDKFRIIVCGDHGTRCSDGKHFSDAVPFAIHGKGIQTSNIGEFSEKATLFCEHIDSLSLIDIITSTDLV